MILAPRAVEIRHGHLFCGIGGGAKGFNKARPVVGNATGTFRCVGGIDVDKGAIATFERAAKVKGTVLDLFTRAQYEAFHGRPAPADYHEATPADIRRAWNYETPHIAFGSAPCKAFSGLLSEAKSKTDKYDALNQLSIRGLRLALEAYADDPIEFWLWENVPRIQTRGRAVLDQMIALLADHGYAVNETTHDCGEIGGLGQHRKRFLLVARHREKVPPFLYEPPKRRVRSVGEVIGAFPVPGAVPTLPMHRLPMLHWQTWVRLAFVRAGGDWRSLNELNVADGVLKDFALVPAAHWYHGALGVAEWNQPAGTVTSSGRPTMGTFSVADPRIDGHARSVQHGVREWDQPAGVVTGKMFVGGGPHSIADPRYQAFGEHYGKMRVEDFDEPSHVVTGSDRVGSGALSIADPRPFPNERFAEGRRGLGVLDWQGTAGTVKSQGGPNQGNYSVADPRILGRPRFNHVFRIVRWGESAPAVAGSGGSGGGMCVADPRGGPDPTKLHAKYHTSNWNEASPVVIAGRDNGACAVADPRPRATRDGKDVYKTQGEYGVAEWNESSGAVTANGQHDNGRWSVADPRGIEVDQAASEAALPNPKDRLVAVIQALDGTYHRPFTTLELAALQSLVDPDEILELEGKSDSAWREWIGNAVPPDAAEAIGNVMGQTLMLAWAGETFALSATPVWVQPIAVALSVKTFEEGL